MFVCFYDFTQNDVESLTLFHGFIKSSTCVSNFRESFPEHAGCIHFFAVVVKASFYNSKAFVFLLIFGDRDGFRTGRAEVVMIISFRSI